MFNNEKIIEAKTCKHCNSSFEITDKDLEFYEKVSPTFGGKKYLIPAPTLCPDCRQQRRLSFRNERKLYKRNCDASGKPIISIYSPDKPFKVYEQSFWWSDKWNPLDYGKDFDFNKSFFQQFEELIKEVPRLSLYTNGCENSYFTNQIYECKNCYLIFSCQNCQDCIYGKRLIDSSNCLDCLLCVGSSNCYSSIDISGSNNCYFSEVLVDCNNVYYSYDCKGCNDCFLCSNLRNKKYCVENIEYSKEDYNILKEKLISLGQQELYKKFANLKNKSIHKHLNIIGTQNVIGDYVKNSKDCFYVSDGGDLDFVKFGQFVKDIKYCYDIDYCCCDSDTSYEISTGGVQMFNCLFSIDIWPNDQYVLYSDSCSSSNHLFGCVGLRNKSYCILNKEYSREEYEILVPKIIEHMQRTGEWGEFFPASVSPFGYNETVSEEYFPLERRDVFEKHLYQDGTQIFNWSGYEPPFPKVDKIIKASMLGENISDVPDDILNWAIECEISKKPFRIIKAELEFYRKHNLPIPKKHPDQRHLDRLKQRNPRKLFDRKCDKCGKDIKTTYSPDRKEIVYCEDCYEKEVY